MSKLYLTHLLNVLIVILVVVLYYNFIFKPSNEILKSKIENEFKQDMTLNSYMVDNAISRFIEGAKSISSRSMIRKKIVEYKSNKISLQELIAYTKPKYLDGINALDACVFAARYVDNIPIVQCGDTSSAVLNCVLSDTVYHKIYSQVYSHDTILNVCIISPIKQKEQILGFDVIYSKCSKILSEILNSGNNFSIVQADEYKENEKVTPLLYKCGKVIFRKKSDYAELYFNFSIQEDLLFRELKIFRKRHIYNMLLIAASIFFMLVIMQQRAKILFFKKSKYLEELVDEKTIELNKLIEELQNSNIALTESKEKLKIKNKELSQINAAKDKLFSIIAHDLMSPFNSMLGFSNLLVKEYDTTDKEKQKYFIDNIHLSITNTYKLLDNLLTWSRTQREGFNFKPSELKLNSIIKEVEVLCKQKAENKDITLTYSIIKNYTLFADKEMLLTILRNLVSNAIKFTKRKGQVELKTRLVDDSEKKFVEIIVKDNGVGISPDKKDKLFNISENITTKGTEEEQGTGLGLIICKEFVDKHGGKIWVESEIGKGSQFIFTIPLSI